MGTSPARLASVDALRGITVAAMLLVNNPGDWSHVFPPLLHADWHGCTPTDLVFPFFLFIVGVSVALGIVPRAEAGAARAPLAKAVLLRAARIVALGLALNLLAWWLLDRPYFRPWGVLQRIGVCFAVAGVLAIHTRPRTQWLLAGGLLLGYWALLAPGGYEPFTNLANRIDTWLAGRHQYRWNEALGLGHDPEGLVSTLPAVATTLLGVRAGAWLRAGRSGRLVAAGVAGVLLGWAWGQVFPLNKPLWTSSYALFTAGWAALAVALCHVLVDHRGWPALGRRFGVNAIAAYAGSAAMVYLLLGLGWLQPIYRHGFGWIAPLAGPRAASLAYAVAVVLLWWAIVAWMDRRGWYAKV